MSLPKIIATTFIGVVILMCFQNCQNARMDAKGTDNGSLGALGTVTPTTVTPDNPNTPGDPNTPTPPTPPITPPDPHTPPGHCDGHDHNHGDNPSYVCVIDAPGCHNGNLGIERDEDQDDGHGMDKAGHSCQRPQQPSNAVHPKAKVLCISKEACEKIAGKVFKVTGAVYNKACQQPSNTEVVHMSDDDVQKVCDKYKADHPQ